MSIAAVTIAMKLEILRTQKSTTEGCSEWQRWLREPAARFWGLREVRGYRGITSGLAPEGARGGQRALPIHSSLYPEVSAERSRTLPMPTPGAALCGSSRRQRHIPPGAAAGLTQRPEPLVPPRRETQRARGRGRGQPNILPSPTPAPLRPAPSPRPAYLRGSRASAGWRWRTAPGSACCTARQREPAAWWATEWRKCRWWSLTGE